MDREYIAFIFGLLGTLLGTINMMPQVYKTVSSNKFDGLSYYPYILSFLGGSCWITYGHLLNQHIVYISSIFSMFFSSIILFSYWRHQRKERENAGARV